MGFDKNGVRLLLNSKKRGVDFQKTITIGRQGLHLSDISLADSLHEFGFSSDLVSSIRSVSGGFADNFLKLLGANDPQSLDASGYEQATNVHDMNLPIPENLKNRFSVVLDGGSLEHVFNFPVAIKNCMEMVALGGHFLSITPCNNNMGHGFYQFSPELFYRVLSKENGFEVEQMIFYTDQPKANWYQVSDPEQVRSRVALLNSYSAYLFVVAKKVAVKNIFETTPQQSDYQANWSATRSETKNLTAAQAKNTSPFLPSSLRWWLLKLAYKIKIGRTFLSDIGSGNRAFFRKIG